MCIISKLFYVIIGIYKIYKQNILKNIFIKQILQSYGVYVATEFIYRNNI